MVAAAIAASAVVGAGASLAASKSASSAANKAGTISNAQASADRRMQWDMYQQQRKDYDRYYGAGKGSINQGYDQAIRTLDPYDNNGVAATNRLAALGGVGGAGAQLSALQSDPGYQFRMQQGNQALDRSAAGRGLLLSGAQLKGLSNFNQGLASEELNNAYNRTAGVADAARGVSTNISNLQSGRGTALGNLAVGQGSALGGLTTNTTNAVSQIGQNNAQNQIQAQNAIGQARASGYTGVGNAAQSAASNGLFYAGMKNGWFK